MGVKLTHFVKKSKEDTTRFTTSSVNVNFYYETKKYMEKNSLL